MRQSKTRALAFKRDDKVAGIGAPIEVRRHPSARRMTLKVSHTRRAVIVTMPTGVRIEEAGQFIARHADWVRAKLGEVPDARPFTDGARVPVRGVLHVIDFVGSNEPGANDRSRGRDVVWSQPSANGGLPRLCVAGAPEHASRRLQDWLIVQARKDLGARVAFHAGRLALRPRRLSVRDQTSRWGSCSSSGQLCFSWRLVLAPPVVLDYVAAHEVAHLKEMNHSHRFWALVRQTMPAMDGAKAWLNTHGRELHCYGRSA